MPSQGFLAGFAGADAHHLLQVGHKHLAVNDLACARGGLDGLYHAVHQVVGHSGFDLDLGEKVHDVFSATVQLGVALLTAKPFDFGDRDALHADQ